MGLFERFARVESPNIELVLLPEEGHEPAFIVTVRVLSDKLNNEMVERASPNNAFDMTKFRKEWGQRVVVGWTGLTVANLRRLIPNVVIDEAKLVALYPDKMIPYTAGMAADLHLNAVTHFRMPINEATDDARRQQNERQDEDRRAVLGNSAGPSLSPSE